MLVPYRVRWTPETVARLVCAARGILRYQNGIDDREGEYSGCMTAARSGRLMQIEVSLPILHASQGASTL